MIKQLQDIIPQFSNELQLLILLSQQYINKAELEKIETLEKLVDWKLFFELSRKHRLLSHVVKQINKHPDIIESEIKKQLTDQQKALSKKALLYSRYLTKIHQALKEKSIPHVFFKGPLLSLELYNDIGFRDYRDIDLLVPLNHIEKARITIQDLGFGMHAPNKQLSNKQKKINYTISHHYHLKKQGLPIEIELHWNLTNPKTYFPLETKKIIEEPAYIEIGNLKLPYIPKIANISFLAAHGSIHQWYRLFWLKDFSEIIRQSKDEKIQDAWLLSQKYKLEKTFIQACMLSSLLYKSPVPAFLRKRSFPDSLIQYGLNAIGSKDLRQHGIVGKINFIGYRLKLKPDFNYYASLIVRLRTHYTDWEILPLPGYLFFLYYFLRPFFLIYKFISKK